MFELKKSKLILILIAATFFAYLSSLGNPFVWDDEQFITSNQFVQNFDLVHILTQSTTSGGGVVSNYYRPLTTLSFAIDKAIWGQNVFGYHLTNLMFHIGAGVLLFLLLEEFFSLRLRSGKNLQDEQAMVGQVQARKSFSLSDPQAGRESKDWNLFLNPAFWISLFFLIHPIQVEAVTYINSRGDSMFAFFLFGSLLLFQKALRESDVILSKAKNINLRIRSFTSVTAKGTTSLWRGVQDDKKSRLLYLIGNDKVLFTGSLFLFILSILSKETAIAGVGIYIVILLHCYIIRNWTMRQWSNFIQKYKSALITVGILLGIVVVYVVLRLTIFNFENTLNYYSGATFYSSHLYVRVFTFAHVLWVYLGLLVWPYPLHMERGVGLVTTFFSPWVISIGGLIVGIVALGFWEFFKKHTVWILFGLIWFLEMLVPGSGIIPINGILYEHWLYVPMIGFWIMIYGIGKLMSFWGVQRTTPESGSLRVDSGQTRMTIKQKLLISFALLLSILYIVLTIRQNNIWSDPVTFYRYTLSFAPDSARLHNNLGMSLADRGDIRGSITEYKKALSLGSDYPQIYNNLGNAQMQIGDYKEAEKNLEKSLQLSPQFTVARDNLIKLYLLSKQYDRALNLSSNSPEVEKLIQKLENGSVQN